MAAWDRLQLIEKRTRERAAAKKVAKTFQEPGLRLSATEHGDQMRRLGKEWPELASALRELATEMQGE